MPAVTIPYEALPVRIQMDAELLLDDDQYFAFCMANPDLRIERTARGEIVILAPCGGEAAYQATELACQLLEWSNRDGRGKSFGCTEFILPTRAALSPDAAWVSNQRLSVLSREQKRKFPPLQPEFIVQMMSPNDRLRVAQAKMEEWRHGGVELGWLIQPDEQSMYVYRAGQPGCEKHTGITHLSGEGSVAGFELDLTEIWAGL
jgi:Uma2 family endonuclease